MGSWTIATAAAILASLALTVSTASAQSVNLSGSWACCGSGGAAAQEFSITDSNGSLSGTASSGSGVFATISGSVSGTSVRIVTTYNSFDPGYIATFSGAVNASDTAMAGSWESNAGQSGTWTAARIGAPPGGTTSNDVVDCIDGCSSFEFDVNPQLGPQQNNLIVGAGCNSTAPSPSDVARIATLGICLTGMDGYTPDIPGAAELAAKQQAELKALSQLAQQWINDLAGSDTDGQSAGNAAGNAAADAIDSAASSSKDSSLLNAVDSSLNSDFPTQPEAGAFRPASGAAASAKLNVRLVIRSLVASHPTAAEIKAFATAVTLATAPKASRTRAVARLTLKVAAQLGYRTIGRALGKKTLKQLKKAKLPALMKGYQAIAWEQRGRSRFGPRRSAAGSCGCSSWSGSTTRCRSSSG